MSLHSGISAFPKQGSQKTSHLVMCLLLLQLHSSAVEAVKWAGSQKQGTQAGEPQRSEAEQSRKHVKIAPPVSIHTFIL